MHPLSRRHSGPAAPEPSLSARAWIGGNARGNGSDGTGPERRKPESRRSRPPPPDRGTGPDPAGSPAGSTEPKVTGSNPVGRVQQSPKFDSFAGPSGDSARVRRVSSPTFPH